MVPKDIALKRIRELIDISDDIKNRYDIVFVNLNSVLSILSRIISDFESKSEIMEWITDLNDIFRELFISLMNKKVYVYYTCSCGKTEHYRIPKWRSDFVALRNNTLLSRIFDFFVEKLKSLSTQSTNVTLVSSDIHEISLIPFYYVSRINTNDKILILSRDRLDFMCLTNDRVDIWDGQCLIEASRFRYHISNKLPNYISNKLLPLYTIIRGIPRLCYGGMRGYGDTRTKDFIMDNLAILQSESFTKKITTIDDLELFDFSLYLANYTVFFDLT